MQSADYALGYWLLFLSASMICFCRLLEGSFHLSEERCSRLRCENQRDPFKAGWTGSRSDQQRSSKPSGLDCSVSSSYQAIWTHVCSAASVTPAQTSHSLSLISAKGFWSCNCCSSWNFWYCRSMEAGWQSSVPSWRYRHLFSLQYQVGLLASMDLRKNLCCGMPCCYSYETWSCSHC